LEPVAATPTGGAETSARPDVSAEKPASITDRLKASIFPAEKPKTEEQIAPVIADKPVEAKEPQAKPEAPTEVVDEPTEDASGEEQEASFHSLSELAEGLGWDQEKILDLEAATKVDGKEGKARLRDLIKSYQLEGHLNQKLMTFADEKKAFEAERQTFAQQTNHKIQQIDASVRIATKLLEGEFANVNWDELRADPAAFNAKALDFEHRKKALDYLSGQIGQEQQIAKDNAAKQQQAYVAEQFKLLESKLPEWSDSAKKSKDIAEMATVLNESYGLSEQELKSEVDHRLILIARDAVKWQKLQKSKPATLAKIKTAPKLLKPGAQQSRAAQEGLAFKQDAERLRRTGRVADAKAPLKRLLFKT
jgi:hypothetical protein